MSNLPESQLKEIMAYYWVLMDDMPFFNEEGKTLMKDKILYEFVEAPQFDDEANIFTFEEYATDPDSPRFADLKVTRGIKTLAQAKRFNRWFVGFLLRIKAIALETYFNYLSRLHPSEKAAELSENLAKINREELFDELGIRKMTNPEFTAKLKKLFGEQFNFAKEQARLLSQAPKLNAIANLGSQESVDLINTVKAMKQETFEAFNELKKSLEYNYPVEFPPMSAYHQWQYNLSNFKKEVLSNLIIMAPESRMPYFSRLLFELEELLPHAQSTVEELEALYQRHGTTEEQLLRNRPFENPLHIALYAEPPKLDETLAEGFNRDTENIQFTFYNYHYGEAIREAIKFLDEQAVLYAGGVKQDPSPTPIKAKTSSTGLSFKYIKLEREPENLKEMMLLLKSNALIHKDTPLAGFKSVFSEKEVQQKIIWTGNISELAYFIKTLHNTAKKVEDTKQRQWEITIRCFQMADGSELSKDKLRAQKKPAQAGKIEKAVNNL